MAYPTLMWERGGDLHMKNDYTNNEKVCFAYSVEKNVRSSTFSKESIGGKEK